MFQSRKDITHIALPGGQEVAVGGEVIDIVRSEVETVVRTRIAGMVRDVVFCWLNKTGRSPWTAGIRRDGRIPQVRNGTIVNALGVEITPRGELVTFSELDPNTYVVLWRPVRDRDANIACYGADGQELWTVGPAPARPRLSYTHVFLRTERRLEAEAAGGYMSLIDRETGVVYETIDVDRFLPATPPESSPH